mmetsp:Transcript_16446/g.27793  ORF Transcript_16446/g.27793 Transcript_16446/m.27793 type:complete len:101 (+) Transcript_16446:653-955(+)
MGTMTKRRKRVIIRIPLQEALLFQQTLPLSSDYKLPIRNQIKNNNVVLEIVVLVRSISTVSNYLLFSLLWLVFCFCFIGACTYSLARKAVCEERASLLMS